MPGRSDLRGPPWPSRLLRVENAERLNEREIARAPCPGNRSCYGARSLKRSTASQRVGHAQWLAPPHLQRRGPLGTAERGINQLAANPFVLPRGSSHLGALALN